MCRLASQEKGAAFIGASLRIQPPRVARLLARRVNRLRVAQLRAEKATRLVEHEFEMVGLLPKARKVLEDGFENQNARIRLDTAKFLHSAVVEPPVERKQVRIEGRLEHDLSPMIAKISESLAALRESNQGRDPLARVKRGSEIQIRALPDGSGS